MFGYIHVYDPDLRLRELDCYRGVYCGLCRAQGACTGQCSRLMLSYDFVFMALMRMALTDEPVSLEVRRCPVHPFRRRPMARVNDPLRLTARSVSLLAWHKLEDDRRDERGTKYLRATLSAPFASHARRRAMRDAAAPRERDGEGERVSDGAQMDADIAAAMRRLRQTEQEKPMSVDEPAQLFGDLLGTLLSHGLEGGTARIARQIGLHTGRWIYILDAADDYAEDVRRGRYNPFRCLYREDAPTLSEQRREEIRLALLRETDGISDALDLLDIHDRNAEGVLRNIVSQGMPRTARSILQSEPEKKKKIRGI